MKGHGVARRGFDAKAWSEAWERHLFSADVGIDLDSSADAARKCTRPSQGPKYVLFLNVHMSCSRDEYTRNPSCAPQQPDAGTSVPREELRRELRRADRDPLDIFRTPTDPSAAYCGPRRLLGRVVILAFGSRACASADGWRYQRSRDTRRHGRTDVDFIYTREHAQSDST